MRQDRNSQNRNSKQTGSRSPGRPVPNGSDSKFAAPDRDRTEAWRSKPPHKNAASKSSETKPWSEAKKFQAKKPDAKKLDARKPAAKQSAARTSDSWSDPRPDSRLDSRPNSRPTSPPKQPFKRPDGGKNRSATTMPATSPAQAERIAKIIARAGLCSRRNAEAWIAEGKVAVNGKVLTSTAVTIGPTDQITVDGKPLAERQRSRLFLFHKPRGLVTTHKDPEGRQTIFDYLHEHAPEAPRLMSIGRLDINTEGLLLLTNDGGLARILELPSTGWLRRYRVRANGETDQAVLDKLGDGVTIDGLRYAGIEATLDRQQGANCWLTMGLREGKNREIKRVLEHLGLAVNRLIRISFGPFQLGDLGEGKIDEVRTRVLRDQLGPALAQAAGVDFDSPMETASEPDAAVPDRRPAATRKPRAHTAAGDTHSRRDARPNTKPNAKSSRFGANTRRAPKAEAELDKPRSRPVPGPRKYISALRAEDGNRDAKETRRHIERGEIADRKGRAVTIERHVVAAEPAKKKPTRHPTSGGGPQPGRPAKPGRGGPPAARHGAPKHEAPARHGASKSSASRPGASRPGAFKPGTSRPGAGGKGPRTK